VVYLYDGSGEGLSYQVALSHAARVVSLGSIWFCAQLQKIYFGPYPVLDWLGFTIDLPQDLLSALGKKIKW